MYIGISIIMSIIGIINIFRNLNNYIRILLSIELITISLIFLLIQISLLNDDIQGIALAIYILSIAAAEAAITLTMIINFNKYLF